MPKTNLIQHRNNKRNLKIARAEVSFQKTTSRLAAIGSGIKTKTKGYRIEKFSHGLIGALLLTACMAPRTAEAKTAKKQAAQNEPAQNNQVMSSSGGKSVEAKQQWVTVAIPAEFTGLPMAAAALPLANSPVEVKPVSQASKLDEIRVEKSDGADDNYQKNHNSSFEKDEKNIRALLLEISKESTMLYCKLKSLAENKNFRIRFVTPKELEELAKKEGVTAAFYQNVIYVIQDFSLRNFNKRALIHELQHAFLSGQLVLLNNNPSSLTQEDYIASAPFALEQQNDFYALIKNGKDRVISAVHMIAKRQKDLLPKEQKTLKKLIEAAKGYVPFCHQVDPNLSQQEIDRLIQSGELDGETLIFKRFDLTNSFYNLFRYKYEKVADQYVPCVRTTDTSDLSAKELLLVALKDVLLIIRAVELSYADQDKNIMLSECDAYVHEALSSNHKLLSLLFPELIKHHRAFAHESYRECLDAAERSNRLSK